MKIKSFTPGNDGIGTGSEQISIWSLETIHGMHMIYNPRKNSLTVYCSLLENTDRIRSVFEKNGYEEV